jgi:predicted N-acetyltransferase YhbS
MGNVEELQTGKPPYSAPRPISPDDRVGDFDCDRPELNEFLRNRAAKNEGKASRTFVVCSAAGEVAGFYTLAAGAVALDEVPGKLRRNMPNPLPVTVLGRLAVDLAHAGRGLGKAMLKEAMQRSLDAAKGVGARAIIVHAIDDEAVTFYTRFGFQAFPSGGRTLFLPLETIAAAL